MYSPPYIHLKFSPSNFLTAVKTTVFAGILRPILKVSVENNTFKHPS